MMGTGANIQDFPTITFSKHESIEMPFRELPLVF